MWFSDCGPHLNDDSDFVHWTRSGVVRGPHSESQFLGPCTPNKHVDAVRTQHKARSEYRQFLDPGYHPRRGEPTGTRVSFWTVLEDKRFSQTNQILDGMFAKPTKDDVRVIIYSFTWS